jgi:hypothetical protein
MLIETCDQCGSSEIAKANFQPRDLPSRFYLMECAQCGRRLGMVNLHSAQDAYHRRDIAGRKLARILLAVEPVQAQ